MLAFNSNIISNICKILLLCVSIHISYCLQINYTPVRLQNDSDKFVGQFQSDYCNYVRNCAPIMKYSHPRNEIHIPLNRKKSISTSSSQFIKHSDKCKQVKQKINKFILIL